MLLENRLDGVMISFNATLAQNSNIRKEIDHLVGERAHFNEMIARLQKKIATNKKTISDLMELAIQAYDQRDEAQSKIQAMKEKNEKDARNYAEEMKELQRTLDHDEKLKDFLFAMQKFCFKLFYIIYSHISFWNPLFVSLSKTM